MARKIKGGLKGLIVVVVLAAAFGGFYLYQKSPHAVGKLAEVGRISLPDLHEASLVGTAAVKIDKPSTDEANNGGLKINMFEMQWMAQSALNFANGGIRTTKGSLFDKAGIDMTIVTDNDDFKSRDLMVKWVQDYHDGKTKDGFFIADMGSQMDSYIGAMDSVLKPLGADYQIVIFGKIGRSLGEDQVIGDIKYQKNPQLLRGAVLHGVFQGGDLDIGIKLANDNGIPVNSNQKYYYPDALNLSYGETFISVVNDYNLRKTQTRRIVINNKTGKDTTVGIDLVATWTPGDINAIVGGGENSPRGGATIMSTKQYAAIMPCLLITCKKFLKDNRDKIEAILASTMTAADQIRTFSDQRDYSLTLDSKIWNERDPAFWIKYYQGVKQDDAFLGGSMVSNASDVAKEFGLNGTTDIYKEVYNSFYEAHVKAYGKAAMANAPRYEDVVDKSYMRNVIGDHPELLAGKAYTANYSGSVTKANQVASKNEHVNFATAKAEIQPSSFSLVDQLYTDVVASEGLKVAVYGYTDNTGDAERNQLLSEERAESVKEYFIKKGLSADRIESKGYGDADPVATNATAAGKAANRRVSIVLGNTN